MIDTKEIKEQSRAWLVDPKAGPSCHQHERLVACANEIEALRAQLAAEKRLFDVLVESSAAVHAKTRAVAMLDARRCVAEWVDSVSIRHIGTALELLAPMPPKLVAIDVELVEQLADWLRSNPPTNGIGQLDRGADNEREELLAALRRLNP